jgi:hypothetical protein
MKRFLCITLFLCIIFPASAGAVDYSYDFIGSTNGGTGTATMDITINTNQLIIDLYNTSPTSLDSPLVGSNAPGIIAFGINLQDPDPAITSWTLYANDADGNPAFIGDNAGISTEDWVLSTFLGGSINLDILPKTEGQNVKGALYNPDADTGFGAEPNYFTKATLTVNFANQPIFEYDPDKDSPFVRMLNVGEGGEGSLKLVVPEPSTMIISGLFLLGAGVFVRRKLHRKS